MWFLTSLTNPDIRFVLLVGKSYIVGRKGCDILVEDDAAVSRRHAELNVTHLETNLSKPQNLPVLTLKDLSKYGTMVNKVRVQGQITLSDGDEVIFGSPKSTYLVVYEPFLVSTSCLSTNLKKQVRGTVARLGGHVVTEWTRNCDVLVMSSISVTIKVVCAMVSLKPIVSPDYLDAYLIALEAKKKLPDPETYLPTVSESQVDPTEVSFTSNLSRRNIFQGKTFVFLQEKQKMSLAVELGGGMPLLMEARPERREEGVLTHKDTVIMNCGCDEQAPPSWKEWYRYVEKTLARNKKHMSQDAELGFAVLHCDTDQYCNPNVDFASQMVSRLPSQSLSQAPMFTDIDTQRQGRVKQDQTTPPTPKRQPPSSVGISPTTSNVEMKNSPVPNTKDHQEPQKKTLSPVFKDKKERTPPPSPKRSQRLNETSGSPSSSYRGLRSESRSPVPEVKLAVKPSSPGTSKEKTKSSPGLTTNIKHEKSAVVTKSRAGKRQIIEDDSDDDYNFTRKSKKKRLDSSDDDDFDVQSRKASAKVTSQSQFSQRQNIKTEKDVDVIRESDSGEEEDEESSRGQMSRSRMGQGVTRVPDSESDEDVCRSRSKGQVKTNKTKAEISNGKQQKVGNEEFNMENMRVKQEPLTPSSTPSKRRRQDEDVVLSDEERTKGTGENEPNKGNRSQRDRQEITTKQEKITPRKTSPGKTDKEREEYNPNGQQQTRRREPNMSGFMSAVQPQGENGHHGTYVKEEGVPTDLMQTVFVDLVSRRPRPEASSGQDADIPQGYSRWKDKIVRNFKKFRKANSGVMDRLPNIIGGSDLVPHISSQRKELDDWFREQQQAESQQTEADRRAQELFEWEPRSTNRNR